MRSILLLLCLWAAGEVHAQIKEPVKWNYSAKKLGGGWYELHLTATIDAGWHTYSETTPGGGPVPTAITFTANPLLEIVGKPKEVGKLDEHFEKLFGVNVRQFSDKLDLVQKVKLKKPVRTNASGSIEFMVCNDRECLPPSTVTFSIPLQ